MYLNCPKYKNASVQKNIEILIVPRALNQQYTFVTFDLAAAKRHVL
jgi:hypothetical protein